MSDLLPPEAGIIIASPDATEADLAAVRALHPDVRVVAVAGSGDAAGLQAALAGLCGGPGYVPLQVADPNTITLPYKPRPAVECVPYIALDVPVVPARRKRRQEARKLKKT
jgi:hypothetical protein